MANLGENGCRGLRRVRDKLKVLLFRAPRNGCKVLDDPGIKVIYIVVQVNMTFYAMPARMERGIRMDRFAMHEGIRNAEKVTELHVTEVHRCRCIIEVNLHALIRNAYRPEQPACSDTRVEVVDLVCKIIRDNLPLIEVQSNEAEGTAVFLPIHPNVDPLHEAHIGIEVEGGSFAGMCVCGCPRPLDLSASNRAMKIGDCRWIDAMSDWEYVEQLGSGTKGLDTAGNGSRCVAVR